MYDVAIVGAGPAGASAAIFTAKAGKKTLVIDNDKGITRRAWLENYYGIPELTGSDIVDTGKKQAAKFGAELMEDRVVDIQKNGSSFTLHTEQGQQYEAKQVILATGVLVDLAEKVGLKTKPGTEPRIKEVFDVDEQGKTNIEGIWAAGTCAGVSVHVVITAGDGAKVAINLLSEMNGERYVDHDVLKS